jgi:uncharacterized protein involved in exopolysaccharide biosynthesis
MASSAPIPPHPGPDPELEPAEAEVEDGLDLARSLEVVGFVLRAPRRRPALAATVLLLSCLLTAAVALFAPRVYTVSTRILVQRNVVIPLLGNPRRPLPTDWDVPTKGTSESILRRDNLTAIVKETDLVERWRVGRSPALRLLDRVGQTIFGPEVEAERIRAIVGLLEKKISVQVDETTITISLAWHDPVVGYEIVSALERSFFRDRSETETAAITETIAILEKEAARQREAIDADVLGAQNAQAKARPGATATPRRPASGRALLSSGAGEPSVASLLAQKRSAIQAMEDPWQRRLVDLKAQLASLRLTYASAHPSIIVLEEKVRQATAPPPELIALKREESALLEQVKELSRTTDRAGEPPSSPGFAGVDAARPSGDADDSPERAPAKARLAAGVQKYEDVRARIDSARIELNTAQAAFKYRYAIVGPAEVPKQPTRPSLLLILLCGAGLSILLSIAVAGVKDLTSDRLIEPWQARRLSIPVLAEVKKS